MVHSSAATTLLGHPYHRHQDWFDENDEDIKRLLEEMHRLQKHVKMIPARYQRKQQPTAIIVNSPEQALGRARILAEQESRRNLVFCRQKEHEEVP